jgi:hypothetical protein
MDPYICDNRWGIGVRGGEEKNDLQENTKGKLEVTFDDATSLVARRGDMRQYPYPVQSTNPIAKRHVDKQVQRVIISVDHQKDLQ